MFWFIAAALFGVAMFVFMPNHQTTENQPRLQISPSADKVHYGLLILPILTLLWLIVSLFNGQANEFTYVAIGFVLTAIMLVKPALRKYAVILAGVTTFAIAMAVIF